MDTVDKVLEHWSENPDEIPSTVEGSRTVQTEVVEALTNYTFEGEPYLEDMVSECANSLVDSYTASLEAWAGTPEGREWIENAVDEFGPPDPFDLDRLYMMGQYAMYSAVAHQIYHEACEAVEEEDDHELTDAINEV